MGEIDSLPDDLCKDNGLTVQETVSYGFGPLTFWKKEILPFDWSVKRSGFLERLAAIRLFGVLKIFVDSWVIRLEKDGLTRPANEN